MKAWHFTADKLRDGRPLPRNGRWLKHDGPVEICKSGLHASREPFDALQYAPGDTLCLVEVEDVVKEQDDKLVARRRKIIARIDATKLLRYFARMQALSCLDKWQDNPPDVVLAYLMTGDETLRSVAESAAWSAAWSATWNAAESAAWSATWNAAWSAAESAAGSAAESAARAEFNALVYETFADYL